MSASDQYVLGAVSNIRPLHETSAQREAGSRVGSDEGLISISGSRYDRHPSALKFLRPVHSSHAGLHRKESSEWHFWSSMVIML